MNSLRNKSARFGRILTLAVLVFGLSLLSACGGGGGGGDFSGASAVAGRALAPAGGTTGGDTPTRLVPVANGTVTTIDFSGREVTGRTQEVGTTDADGNYSVTLAEGGGAIVINGQVDGSDVRISGLLQQSSANSQKDFDPATDIACQAFFSAFNTGVLESTALTQTRIDNLETAARTFLENNTVDFFDPAQVTAAALAVRESTNNGETSGS